MGRTLSAGQQSKSGPPRQTVLLDWLKIRRDEGLFQQCRQRLEENQGEGSLGGVEREIWDVDKDQAERGGGRADRGLIGVTSNAGVVLGSTKKRRQRCQKEKQGMRSLRTGVDEGRRMEGKELDTGRGHGMAKDYWDKESRRQLYEEINQLVANPLIPELTVDDAKAFISSIQGTLRESCFFPPDIMMAARSLKLTRRLFHVEDSKLCRGKGLWLNKGCKLVKGTFVGFYVGWVYTESHAEAVWDPEYLDNTYSLGLLGVDGVDDNEILRVNARDNFFDRQDKIFPLGFTNEWIWNDMPAGRQTGGNSLYFGKHGMVYAQCNLCCSRTRLEVTIGFGKEGTPFGGWTQYTLSLSQRIVDVAMIIWTMVQSELPVRIIDTIKTELMEAGEQLRKVHFSDLSAIRESRTLIATLISGVELQDVDVSWGQLTFDERCSVADNLRRFVLHPEVRKRCSFRQADIPGKSSSTGTGSVDHWRKVLLRNRHEMTEVVKRREVCYEIEGKERVDGQWVWCIPMPLRVLSMGKDEGGGSEQAIRSRNGRQAEIEDDSMLAKYNERMEASPGLLNEVNEGLSADSVMEMFKWNGSEVERRRESVAEREVLEHAGRQRDRCFGEGEGGGIVERHACREDGKLMCLDEWRSVEGEVEESSAGIRDGDNWVRSVEVEEVQEKCLPVGWGVGTRWIYEFEECEIVRLVSGTEVEIAFLDRRLQIVSGPLEEPEMDDFIGWPSSLVNTPKEVRRPSPDQAVGVQLYKDDLDIMGFSGGVKGLLTDIGTKIDCPVGTNVRVATWNASGLIKMSKVRYMMALMALANLDIFCIQDTRVEPGQWKDEVEKEIRTLLGPGGSVFVATVAPRGPGSRGPNVGGQILIKSPRIRSSCLFSADASELGVVCTLDMQMGVHDIRIVSVYVPPSQGETVEALSRERESQEAEQLNIRQEVDYRGALSLRVHQYINRSDKWEGCIDYILGTAQTKIEQHLKIPGGVVYCMGDFNAGGMKQDKRSVNGTIVDWCESVGLRQSLQGLKEHCPCTFFRGTEAVSAIDHILFSDRNGVSTVESWVLDDSLWLSMSNHCPLVVDFNMPGLNDKYISRRGRLKAVVREHLDICRAYANSEERQLRDVVDYQQYLMKRLNLENLKGSADDQMETILRATKAALRSIRRRRRKVDWWSPIVVALTTNLLAVQEMEKYAHGRGRPIWSTEYEWQHGIERVVQNWISQVGRIAEFRGDGDSLDLLNASGNGPEYWRKLQGDKTTKLSMISMEIRRLRTIIRQQERVEIQQLHQDRAARRLLARTKGLHLRELREMLGRKGTRFSMDYIVDDGLYIVDAADVHNTVSEHFRQWFSTKRRDSGFLAPECDYIRLWSDKEFFMSQNESLGVPPYLLEIVWKAMQRRVIPDMQQQAFERSISEAPTLAEFQYELARTSRHSASGPTGVTYNSIAGWPREVMEKVYSLLLEFWNDETIPRCWKWRWLVPIPKKAENVTLNDLRPLMLTDTLRKVWVGVIVRKIQNHIESCGLLSRAQHGTLSNRSTEGALVQFRNILEEARESCTDVFLSSWDVVRAFDKLQRNVQVMCWVRLGIPMEVASYLVSMDEGGITMVRTPYAEQIWEKEGVQGFSTTDAGSKAAAFAPSSGTGQGNIDSPLVWTAFMDVLLCALSSLTDNQFYIRTQDCQGDGLKCVQDISFVDDLISLTSRLEGLQAKANVVCAFFLVFGMDSARIKFRTFQVEWGSEYTDVDGSGVPSRPSRASVSNFILVYKEGWKARKVRLQTYRTAPPFKYLGVLFDLSNSDIASFEWATKAARTHIARVGQSKGDMELRVEAIVYCVYPQLVYSAKFASWPLRKYVALDKIFSAAFRRVLGLRRGFPEELLYAPWGVRGLGIPRFSDEVQMAKLAILSRGSTADSHTRESTMGLLLRGLRQQNIKPLYTQAAVLSPSYISTQSLFIRSLSEWLAEGEMALRKGGTFAVDQSYTSLVEYCRLYGSPLSSAETSLLESYGLSAIGDIVAIEDFVEECVGRRGRSSTRRATDMRMRRMEGMKVVTERGGYMILRYVSPSFAIKWEDDRMESLSCDSVVKDIERMGIPPEEVTLRWAVLPTCLQFLYSKIPPLPPALSSITLMRDQCWVSPQGRYPLEEGWIWEVLGFAGGSICIRLWRVDDGVNRRQIRVGVEVRLVSPSHGAASTYWIPQEELLCGDGWGLQGTMHRVLLGPDMNKGGIQRSIVAISTQPQICLFKSEMEIDILSTIHQYGGPLSSNDIFTDGSVVQEMNPVVNSLIPSPALVRQIGKPPTVSGALIARCDSPVTHGMEVAFRIEDGQAANCRDSYDIEMIMITLAVLIRDQLRDELTPACNIFSDCKSAVLKATQMDLSQVRKVGHKEHGLLLRRLYHSRGPDSTLLRHVKGHPERRLPRGVRWKELMDKEAGIFLADRIADAKMSETAKYLWEHDGSVRYPMVTIPAPELLKLFASIDLLSVIQKDGIPIIASPLSKIQEARFTNYLKLRDKNKEEKIWTQYIPSVPQVVFGDERLYSRRAKVTKTVFNWYARAEHWDRGRKAEVSEPQGVDSSNHDSEEGVALWEKCRLCGNDLRGDTERHLYTDCLHDDITRIRQAAVTTLTLLGEGKLDDLSSVVLGRVRELLLDIEHRHRVWKGVITVNQALQVLRDIEDEAFEKLGYMARLNISQLIKAGLRVGGNALMDIRRASWRLGGAFQAFVKALPAKLKSYQRVVSAKVSIASSLGILSQEEAVKWELARRRKRRDKAQALRERSSRTPKASVGNSSKETNHSHLTGRDRGRMGAQRQRSWDVH